jgi:hypothetical protein
MQNDVASPPILGLNFETWKLFVIVKPLLGAGTGKLLKIADSFIIFWGDPAETCRAVFS